MHNLIIRLRNGRLAHQILQHKTVLDFAHSQNGVEAAVGISHGADDGSHVGELLLILDISPFVLTVRQELLIVLCRIVISVEQVFQIVETYDIVLVRLACLCLCGHRKKHHQDGNQSNCSFHQSYY